MRLIGVDTPEVYGGVECYGREASAFVERTVPLGSEVRYRLGVEERDRYGRALAYVWLRDGRFLNRLLVARGYAQPMTVPPNVEYEDAFVRAAACARGAPGRPDEGPGRRRAGDQSERLWDQRRKREPGHLWRRRPAALRVAYTGRCA